MYVKYLDSELRLLKVYEGEEVSWIVNFLFEVDVSIFVFI